MPNTSQMPDEAARKLFLACFFTEVLLVLFYWTDILLASPSPILHALVDLDGEGNLPTWFSSFQLALIALSLGFLALQPRRIGETSRRFWGLLAAGFLFWSLDETAMLHERVTALLGARYVDWLPGYLLKHWFLLVALLATLLLALRLLWSDLMKLWRAARRECGLALCGLLIAFLGGAGLETVGYKLFQGSVNPFLYQTEVCLEEFFEMLGASFLLYAASSLARRQAEETLQQAVETTPQAAQQIVAARQPVVAKT